VRALWRYKIVKEKRQRASDTVVVADSKPSASPVARWRFGALSVGYLDGYGDSGIVFRLSCMSTACP
jgi:hypothetical protein